MGMKKLARKRLFNVEKQGINVIGTIGAATNMRKAIVSASQHRMGSQVITDIVVDLGTNKTTVKTGGVGTNLPVGTLDESGTAELSYLAKLDPAVFGTVVNMEVVCLEIPSDGVLTGNNAYKLLVGDATGKIALAPGGLKTIGSGMNDIGEKQGLNEVSSVSSGTLAATEGGELANGYVYIAGGTAQGTAVGAAAGQIKVQDTFATSQLDSGVSRIVVKSQSGTVVEHIFQSGTDKTASSSGTIGYGGTPSLAEMATSIGAAIHNHAKFSGSVTDKTVAINQVDAGVEGNTTIVLVNGVSAAGAALSADLEITSFAGGTTMGTSTAMTAGKFLIRVEGFMTPDDV